MLGKILTRRRLGAPGGGEKDKKDRIPQRRQEAHEERKRSKLRSRRRFSGEENERRLAHADTGGKARRNETDDPRRQISRANKARRSLKAEQSRAKRC